MQIRYATRMLPMTRRPMLRCRSCGQRGGLARVWDGEQVQQGYRRARGDVTFLDECGDLSKWEPVDVFRYAWNRPGDGTFGRSDVYVCCFNGWSWGVLTGRLPRMGRG